MSLRLCLESDGLQPINVPNDLIEVLQRANDCAGVALNLIGAPGNWKQDGGRNLHAVEHIFVKTPLQYLRHLRGDFNDAQHCSEMADPSSDRWDVNG